MTTTTTIPSGKQILLEIGDSEKQLWALIHSKGLLHIDTQDLYKKVRSGYERTILSNHTLSELQDAEYSLWKLHYKHIDEFRKRIKRGSGNADNTKSGAPQNDSVLRNIDIHLNAFKSFLSEAVEFYQSLIVKLRENYGVSEDALFYKNGCISSSVEPDAMLKCQYLCHRCLVCMGDLARYEQQCENPDIHTHNWSVAATHYLEAARIWPDSGNPHNQLAVLATYIGDEFLALYHCIRSLAVKEPFPDAWNNLSLLFEKNRSFHLPYVSSEASMDFSKSFGSSDQTKARPKCDSSTNMFKGQSNHFADTKLWSLIVRTIGFFFIKSSLEEFPIVLASTIRELDRLLELEDTELKTMLESYEQVNLARRGPFRAIQVVTVLIFVLKHLVEPLVKNEPNHKDERQSPVLIQLALCATFSFMGRFVERCLKSSPLHSCPLLPSVLVFVEWIASMRDSLEVYASDQKSKGAMSYFFGVLIDLVNQLGTQGRETKKLLDNTPLWEDYELRGFSPVACVHVSLDFSGNWEHIDNSGSGIELRTLRIKHAAMKITGSSSDLQTRILCDELGTKFYEDRLDDSDEKKVTGNVESGYTSKKESDQQNYKDEGVRDKPMTGNEPSNCIVNGKSAAVEEEEVILFRPLTRYNSAPSYPSIPTNDQTSPKDSDDQSLHSDDCLRRATSLLMAQNQTLSNPMGFHADFDNFRSNKSFTQAEPSMRESSPHTSPRGSISAGPPSLNAWVLDRGSFSNNRDKGTNGISEHRLEPIEEITSTSMAGLSINRSKDSSTITSSNQSPNFLPSSVTYSNPVPSAPLLPENATWFADVQSTVSTPLMPNIPSPPISGYADLSSTYGPVGYDPSYPAFTNGYAPTRRMTSSEWLRWYRENCTHERANNLMQPTYYNVSRNPENFLYHDPHMFAQFDRWENPLLPKQYTYMEPPAPPSTLLPGFASAMGQQGEQINSGFNNFQRGSPYGCGAVRNEPQPLIEYLKEKEWRLQRDPTFREPTFMGN
ncbi:nonsense-mediated mRNA decay factor SMG7-like [Prosopis cineraria]|uniref:nonsense-mediated mRNA decay factor SMG7-like n=1 Tax=Prosopis cineraria TaxID=364024 RepID=UPI00240F4287|nr:nonsense-mediated mRNA decay factor SMG7-like [Prosopis cineraria]XP_054802333.1 nonsense-mediated mRNA decay factor SMG7-like [Prosopis cineraria]XP_054802334.1 nonsense-mediated mRNA decay factor SMG7-like [Prosopis cineraria]XP_054802335.1 nonsense-mediated mRNA decay factor SMG7-like [Prosopis cineraria]